MVTIYIYIYIYIYVMHVYFRNNKLSLSFYLLFISFFIYIYIYIYIYVMHVYFRNSKLSLSFYLLFISFFSTKFKLIKGYVQTMLDSFGAARKPYQIGLLFIHKNGWGGLISVCDGAKLRLGSDLLSGEPGGKGQGGTAIYGLYRYIPL